MDKFREGGIQNASDFDPRGPYTRQDLKCYDTYGSRKLPCSFPSSIFEVPISTLHPANVIGGRIDRIEIEVWSRDMAAGVPSSVEFAQGLMSRDELVVYYSVVNYSCKEIQRLLQYVHGHIIR